MIGWLGETYIWVKAVHVTFVIFWLAGLFTLPRHFVYHRATAPGSAEDQAWIERERVLLRVIVNPAMIAVWLLGLSLAANLGFQGGWLHTKIALVLLLSGYHGWLSRLRRRFAAGERPLSDRSLRAAGELPALMTLAIVILAVVKPF